MGKDKTIVRLENISLRIRERLLLPNTSWQINQGQHWAILGPNGAGKTSLVRALAGDVPVVKGAIVYSHHRSNAPLAEYVSFEQHRRLIAREELRDDFRYFSGNLNRGTTVQEIMDDTNRPSDVNSAELNRVVNRLGVGHLMDREIRALSTGEMRKIQIARILLKLPQIIILDEPFDGLDESSRQDLSQIIDDLMNDRRTVILVTHRQREISTKITHLMALRDGRVIYNGRREDFLSSGRLEALYPDEVRPEMGLPFVESPRRATTNTSQDFLISMKNVTVKYDRKTVLNRLDWTMRSGQNWVVLGPNGCGKTTLLNLITTDNLQAYANEIFLFGRRRGSGESIWDIKKRIGLISSEFQIRYRKPITAFEVILSGFFDSVGLFRNASCTQRQTAERWQAVLGIGDQADKSFNQLSYGEQRMVLLARAMVKMPQILILDEPYQGLDRSNRQRILDAIDVIGRRGDTNIIYVTHYRDEIPACMTHMLQFRKSPSIGFVVCQQSI